MYFCITKLMKAFHVLIALIIFVYSFWNSNTSSHKPYDKNYNFIQRSGRNNLHVKMPVF